MNVRLSRLAIVLVAALAGCGTAISQDSFRPIDKNDVREQFREVTTTTTTAKVLIPPPSSSSTSSTTAVTTTVPVPSTIYTEDVFLYFVTADGLHLRKVRERRAVPIDPKDVLNDLLKPPADPGLKTQMTPGAVLGVTVGKTTQVALAPTVTDHFSTDQNFLAAQITLTLTALRGISQVEFTMDGVVVAVPVPNIDPGTATLVGESDYSTVVMA
jgi:spore germination protein GerM